MDIFYEQFLKGQEQAAYKVVKVLPFILIPCGLILFVLGFTAISLVIIIWGIASVFFKKFFYIEFEYAFTSGEIDIDQILNRKARRRLVSFHIKDVELMALENSEEYKNYSNKSLRIIHAFPKGTEGRVYAAVVNGGAEKYQFMFMPDEEFVNFCFKFNPRAVKRGNTV